jgi:5'-methylthioadenosine phosphorylase
MQSDVIGMTNVPEVFLAREAQICYCTIGIVTDYDCWLKDPNQHANVADIMARYGQSIDSVKSLLKAVLADDLPVVNDNYRQILGSSVLTPDDALTSDKLELLNVLRT